MASASEEADDRFQLLHSSKNVIYKAIKQPIKTSLAEIKTTEKKYETDSPVLFSSVFVEATVSEKISPRIQQRKEFFNTIRKRYYLDSLAEDNNRHNKAKLGDVTSSNTVIDEASLIANTLRSRKHRLHELRKIEPSKMNIETGIQWICLELFEMREQDKMLYLQLMKVQTIMQEVRSHLKMFEENLDEDFVAGPICLWPRSISSSDISDCSSSDGAKEFKPNRRGLRRDLSLQYHSTSAFLRQKFQNSLPNAAGNSS